MVQVVNAFEGLAQDSEALGLGNLRKHRELGFLDVMEKKEFLRMEFVGKEQLID